MAAAWTALYALTSLERQLLQLHADVHRKRIDKDQQKIKSLQMFGSLN